MLVELESDVGKLRTEYFKKFGTGLRMTCPVSEEEPLS